MKLKVTFLREGVKRRRGVTYLSEEVKGSAVSVTHPSKAKTATHLLNVKEATHPSKVKTATHPLKVKDATRPSKVKRATHPS